MQIIKRLFANCYAHLPLLFLRMCCTNENIFLLSFYLNLLTFVEIWPINLYVSNLIYVGMLTENCKFDWYGHSKYVCIKSNFIHASIGRGIVLDNSNVITCFATYKLYHSCLYKPDFNFRIENIYRKFLQSMPYKQSK